MDRESNHADESDGAPSEAAVTRRSLLANSAATLGTGAVAASGFVGASGVTAAQITEAGAIPDPAKWGDDTDFAGFMIHVGGSLSPERERVAADCELAGSDTWPPDEMLAYDAQLINRKDDATEQAETTLYVGETANVTAGKLYIVNRFDRCDGGFLGVSLEQIGLSDVNVAGDGQPTAGTTTADEGGSGAFGPGFGPLAAVAGLLGGGALLRRRDGER